MSTILAGHKLTISEGGSELAIINMGAKTASYKITQGKSSVTTQLLEGTGAEQIYENVQYPVKIRNTGKETIQVSS